jgi:hypothetical protein
VQLLNTVHVLCHRTWACACAAPLGLPEKHQRGDQEYGYDDEYDGDYGYGAEEDYKYDDDYSGDYSDRNGTDSWRPAPTVSANGTVVDTPSGPPGSKTKTIGFAPEAELINGIDDIKPEGEHNPVSSDAA